MLRPHTVCQAPWSSSCQAPWLSLLGTPLEQLDEVLDECELLKLTEHELQLGELEELLLHEQELHEQELHEHELHEHDKLKLLLHEPE